MRIYSPSSPRIENISRSSSPAEDMGEINPCMGGLGGARVNELEDDPLWLEGALSESDSAEKMRSRSWTVAKRGAGASVF